MTTQEIACAGAPSRESVTWHSIDWAKCHREVRRLQARIVKATREGKHGKVKALQWILTHSFSGKALAVRRVTENQGKKTPGVDGITKTVCLPGREKKTSFPLIYRVELPGCCFDG